MRKSLITPFLLVIFILGHDLQYVDSLTSEMKFSTGKELVGQYLDLAKYYERISPENAIKTALKAIKIAKDNESESLGELYLLIASNYSTITKNDSAVYYTNLGIDYYISQGDTFGMSLAYVNQGVNYDIIGKEDEALEYYKRGKVLAKENGLDEILAAIHINSGFILHRQGKYAEALSEYLNALELDEKTKNLNNITNSYINLGYVLVTANNYEKAYEYFYKALEIAEQVNNQSNLLYIHEEMANLFILKQDYKNAMGHIEKALEIGKRINQKLTYSTILLDKIEVLVATKKFNSVDSLFAEVETNIATLNSVELVAKFYDGKCRYAISKNDYSAALKFHQLAEEQLQKHYYTPEKKLKNQIRLGKIKANLGELDTGISIIKDVVNQSNQIEYLEIKTQAYKELYQIYEISNDFKNAFLNLKNYTHYADTLQILQNKSNIEELEIIYKTQKQNQENELIKKENQIAETRLKIQQIIIAAFVFLILIAVFGIVFVTKSLMNKRKINMKLLEQNETIIVQKMELEKTLASKDRLYSIIGHDLYNAHSNIASFINILNRNIDTIDVNFIQKMTGELKVINDNSLTLLDTLVEWGKIQTKKQTFNPAMFNLKAVVHSNLMLFKKNIDEKKIEVKNNVDNNLELSGDKNMIATVIRNIISNAIKFTPVNGLIAINSKKNDKGLEIEFHDNGIGIQQDILKQLFQIESTITTKGTSGEKGHGLGLIICRELIELHKGKILVESQPDKGTKVKISIPELKTT